MFPRTWPAGSVLIAVVLVMASAIPVFAGVPSGEPSSCDPWADWSWLDNCWVSWYSSDPDQVSDLTTGIQRVLNHNNEGNDNVGAVDGWYGSQSRSGVIAFQQNHGLYADGIVGPNTWSTLQGDLVLTATTSYYRYYRVEGDTPNLFLRERYGLGRWYVDSVRAGGWVAMDRTRT